MIHTLPPPFKETRSADLAAEIAAMNCLEECRTSLRLAQIPLPVPIERWIEHPLKMDYGIDDMPGADGYNVLGTKVIRISPRILDDKTRYRWVLAHELGHARLHDLKSPRLKLDDPRYSQLYANEVERQANRFAAAFLMPLRSLVHSFFDICRARSLDAEHTIVSLLTRTQHSPELWYRVFLPELAERFGVNRYGVLFRLGELRLGDDTPFILPRHSIVLHQCLRMGG